MTTTLEQWREVFVRNGLVIARIHRDEWPRYARQRRLLGRAAGEFTAASRSPHLLPLRYANQFVFLMRAEPAEPAEPRTPGGRDGPGRRDAGTPAIP